MGSLLLPGLAEQRLFFNSRAHSNISRGELESPSDFLSSETGAAVCFQNRMRLASAARKSDPAFFCRNRSPRINIQERYSLFVVL